MSMMEIVSPGLLTTVQDLGRTGYQRYGIPVCGALDSVSLRIANILVGNREHLAGLEITAIGPTIRFKESATIAIVGADLEPTLDGNPTPTWESVYAGAGSALSFGMPRDGLRAYLAVAGGIEAPLVMKSRATDLKGGFGGFGGRALAAGDVLAIGDSPHRGVASSRGLPLEISRQTTYGQYFDIRVVLGPQDDAFTEGGESTRCSTQSTRFPMTQTGPVTGWRGPIIKHISGRGYRFGWDSAWLDSGAGRRDAHRAARGSRDYGRIHEDSYGHQPGHRADRAGYARRDDPVRPGDSRGSAPDIPGSGANDSGYQGVRGTRPERRVFFKRVRQRLHRTGLGREDNRVAWGVFREQSDQAGLGDGGRGEVRL